MTVAETVSGIIVALVIIGVLTPITLRIYLLERRKEQSRRKKQK